METVWENRWLPDQKNGGVAQLGEHLPCKQGVKSSNLSVSIEWVRSTEEREGTAGDRKCKVCRI